MSLDWTNTMLRVRARLKLLAVRLLFSWLVPRRTRDWYLDRQIRGATQTVLAHRHPPETFNEKVRYKMLHDRRPLLRTFADKVAVRRYVEDRIGKEFLPELVMVTEDPKGVRKEALSRQFALKPSHASGACVLVGDIFEDGRLPIVPAGWVAATVSPDKLDWDRLRRLCREWLSRRYRPQIEWAYRDVPRRIVVEELLVEHGALARDYKLFVFHGRVRLVQVTTGRYARHRTNFYSPDWQVVPITLERPRGPEVGRPSSLAEMISIAETLAEETDFARVDLFSLPGRIVFGELTSYPRAGWMNFTPESFDRELGAWWSPPDDYSVDLFPREPY